MAPVPCFYCPPLASWDKKPYCWLLEFDTQDVLERIDRRISPADCRSVFWAKEEMQSLAPANPQTMWQLYAESTDPGCQEWRWLCQAADQGHFLARHRLGTIYYYGLDGVTKDLVLAFAWYSLAEETGDEVKQLTWIRESVTTDQAMSAERLISTWKPGWCEQELLPRVQCTQ